MAAAVAAAIDASADCDACRAELAAASYAAGVVSTMGLRHDHSRLFPSHSDPHPPHHPLHHLSHAHSYSHPTAVAATRAGSRGGVSESGIALIGYGSEGAPPFGGEPSPAHRPSEPPSTHHHGRNPVPSPPTAPPLRWASAYPHLAHLDLEGVYAGLRGAHAFVRLAQKNPHVTYLRFDVAKRGGTAGGAGSDSAGNATLGPAAADRDRFLREAPSLLRLQRIDLDLRFPVVPARILAELEGLLRANLDRTVAARFAPLIAPPHAAAGTTAGAAGVKLGPASPGPALPKSCSSVASSSPSTARWAAGSGPVRADSTTGGSAALPSAVGSPPSRMMRVDPSRVAEALRVGHAKRQPLMEASLCREAHLLRAQAAEQRAMLEARDEELRHAKARAARAEQAHAVVADHVAVLLKQRGLLRMVGLALQDVNTGIVWE